MAMFRNIYTPNNYNEVCPLWYRLWRRFHQAVASLFPPDWIYIVRVQDPPEEGGVWTAGIYLHQGDAERCVAAYKQRLPGAWAEWEQRGLNERFYWKD